jgi:hypothetical protein
MLVTLRMHTGHAALQLQSPCLLAQQACRWFQAASQCAPATAVKQACIPDACAVCHHIVLPATVTAPAQVHTRTLLRADSCHGAR